MKNHIEVVRVTLNHDLSGIIRAISKSKWAPESEIIPVGFSEEDMKLFLRTEENLFVVVYCNKIFAGMSSARLMNKVDGDPWLYIDELDVCQDMHRRGAGSAIMRYFLDFASQNNCVETWVGTELENRVAHAFYRSLTPDSVQDFRGYSYR